MNKILLSSLKPKQHTYFQHVTQKIVYTGGGGGSGDGGGGGDLIATLLFLS